MKKTVLAALSGAAFMAAPAVAQDMSSMPMDHGSMNHGPMEQGQPGQSQADQDRMDMAMPAEPTAPAPYAAGSGTARLPGAEGAMHGIHLMAGDWMAMAHGAVSANYTTVAGPRGDDKLYATSMLMGSLERETSWGRIAAHAMLSLEPAMRRDGYPNLFATGETAYSVPLVDRQHPHDLFMELAGRINVNAGTGSLFVYGGPVGEPALGPSAFMHRGSAAYNPEPPISHHWFDSTHITYGVVTAGYAAPTWQLEGSVFRGREPDERRWNIESGKLDSWSVRATLNPSPRWALQASYGEIKQPEATHPGEDEHRFTASAHYADGRFAAMLAYSAKRLVPGESLPAVLAEATWTPDAHNVVFGRIEHVRNDELFPDHASPLHDVTFRVTKLQAGYARRIPLGSVEVALGGSLATFAKPAALDAAYGRNPVQATVFAKVTLGS